MSSFEQSAIGVLGDVEVTVSAQLGCARLPLATVLALAAGAVVPLDCASDAPATLMVNGVPVARGDLVVDDDGALAIEINEMTR